MQALFVDPDAEGELTALWDSLDGAGVPFETVALEAHAVGADLARCTAVLARADVAAAGEPDGRADADREPGWTDAAPAPDAGELVSAAPGREA